MSDCKQSLELMIVAFCKAFDFKSPQEAARFAAEIVDSDVEESANSQSDYARCLLDYNQSPKVSKFLDLMLTNMNYIINLLQKENPASMIEMQ